MFTQQPKLVSAAEKQNTGSHWLLSFIWCSGGTSTRISGTTGGGAPPETYFNRVDGNRDLHGTTHSYKNDRFTIVSLRAKPIRHNPRTFATFTPRTHLAGGELRHGSHRAKPGRASKGELHALEAR
jgi:hypothetical protein